MSTLEFICYIGAAALFMLALGTIGAIETGAVAELTGWIRGLIMLAAAGGAVYAGRRFA